MAQQSCFTGFMNELIKISRYLCHHTLQAPIEIPTFQHRTYRSYCALLLIRANRAACRVWISNVRDERVMETVMRENDLRLQ